jgi:type I restriction enzyme, S subunit
MKQITLGDICQFEYGKNLPEKVRQKGRVSVFGSNGLVGTHQKGFTKGKTIIIGRKGSIGAVHVSEESCWPIDTTYFVDESCTNCDLDWLSFAIRFLKLGTLNKASGVPGLNRDDAYKQRLGMPESKQRQNQVATLLKVQLAEVEKARKAAQTQADDIRLLRERLLENARHALDGVSVKVLGDHAPTISGTTPSRGNKSYWAPAEIPWVKTGEVAFAPITRTEEAVSRKALAECSLMLLPPKTVLVAMYGQGKTRGQSAILEVQATTNQACFAVLPNDTWTPEFLYHWLLVNYKNLRNLSEGRGGNQANLNGAMLKALQVPTPTPTEQHQWVQRIRSALTEVDAMQAANQSTLEDLTALPQRLLAQAFNDRG